ncbi:hypothetical protein BX667DRAFT_508869 [Coemansia mojavensis]|nr:hypothetical protein BX667DRAFT_508869 [Coemansia mojavensis]
MRKILRQRTQSGASSGTNLQALAASAGARRPRTASDEVSRRSNTARPTTDILSHLQELKAKERQVLGRGPRDTASAGSTNAAGQKQNLSAEELKSRQERQAHEERMASQYRQQLNARMREINESAIDLSHQKTVMAQLERQLLGSSSPRDLEQLELDRVNGIRSLIGLPALPPLPALGACPRHPPRQCMGTHKSTAAIAARTRELSAAALAIYLATKQQAAYPDSRIEPRTIQV